MKVLFLFALLFAVVSASAPHPQAVADFHSWAAKYNKVYQNTAEFWLRFSHYQQTLQRIERSQAANPEAKFTTNQFSDLSPQEFKQFYLTAKPSQLPTDIPVTQVPLQTPLPTKFDWRTHNAVTPVKDQGQCGSCWAFSTTENIESMFFLAGHKLPTLAPQQIVDCDTTDSGCDGGWPMSAYEYVISAGGLDTEASYPYTSGDSGNSGSCQYNPSTVGGNITGYSFAVPACQDACTKQNETLLMEQLVSAGPLSVCVNAEPWQDYSSGILKDCPGAYDDLDHCVQLVGFDTQAGYYLVRNSWNTNWGEEGYIRLALHHNTCGIANCATYAHAKKA